MSPSLLASPVPAEQLLEALRWRYAVKKFDPAREIPAATWSALEQALVLAPSSYGLQPWRFVVVRDPALRAQLLPHSWGQRQIVDAARLVVFAARKGLSAADVERHLRRIAAVRAQPIEALEGYRQKMLGLVSKASQGFDIDGWCARQTYIALGQFLTAAALLGVDSCPMEGIACARYDELLGLAAQGYATVVAATAGYRAADDAYASAAKVRYAAAEVVQQLG